MVVVVVVVGPLLLLLLLLLPQLLPLTGKNVVHVEGRGIGSKRGGVLANLHVRVKRRRRQRGREGEITDGVKAFVGNGAGKQGRRAFLAKTRERN